ncbi:vacuolar protein sorting-associated protein 52, putative [Plasmodium relictum]|uniref:Vacuolar protein sorting-associated protein 52, putative n=1 Tax=Plasmodium relictum TaxID=85471 RepID=A0A1J1HC64_PLARL|nr:vacuolar protein sorting-associated protein 52, putative [Plasmodium relictum]CRH01161.1 vacuolar protein sorting-associated protein 52, putative [Plasmodium relictum]
MEYERISSLIEKFKNDKYILKAYNKIYDYNNCKIYRNVKIEDIENEKYNDDLEYSVFKNKFIEKKDKDEKDKLKHIIEIINQTLYIYTNETLNKFSENSKELLDIYNQIDNCNSLCSDIDVILNKHKNDINFISNDINNIQELTENMNDKLNNRKLTLELLNTYIKIILVTPKLVYDICNGEINENFIKNVNILTKKIENCKHCLYDSYPSIKFSYIELEKLKNKAVERIYIFFLYKINDIKNKKINIHLIQQNLIKFHELNSFLYNNNRNVYNYLVKEYVNVMNRTYHNLFKNYIGDLEKKKIEFINVLTIGFLSYYKNDNNATLLSAKNKMMNMLGFNLNNNNKNDKKENLFLLNNRNKILNDLDYHSNNDSGKSSLPVIFTTDNSQYYFEEIYKSINKLFLDTGTAEYLFISNFFKNYENQDFLFLEIYSKTITLCFDFIYYYMNDTFDFISLFFIYIINLQNGFTIRNRNIFSLYEFIDKIQNLLWKKIYLIIDQNIKSLNYRNHNMNDLTKNSNKKTIYNFIYTNKINNENKNYNTIVNYDTSNNPNSNIRLNSDLEEKEKDNMQTFQEINHNEITKNNFTNSLNDIEKNQMNNSSTYIKTQTHYITKRFSDFYSSFIIMSDLCFKYEKYYVEKYSEKKDGHNNKIDEDNENLLNLEKKKKKNCNKISLNIHEDISNKNDDTSSYQCEMNELKYEKSDNEKGNNEKGDDNLDKVNVTNLKKNNDIGISLNIDNNPKDISDHIPIVNYSNTNIDNLSIPNLPKLSDDFINDNSINVECNTKISDISNNDNKKSLITENIVNDSLLKKSNDHKNNSYLLKELDKKNSEVTNYEVNENKTDDFESKYKNLGNFVLKLEEAIVDALVNLSKEFSYTKDKLLFLINNYYHIIYVLKENEINEEKIIKFEKLLEKETSLYIDHQLNEYIKEIIIFVNKHENIINNLKEEEDNIISYIDVKSMESIAVNFSKEWKNLLKEIKQNVINSFTNFDNSLNILKLLSTKVLLYYTRYYQLIKKVFSNSQIPIYIQKLPSVDIVLTQIKKNSKNSDT